MSCGSTQCSQSTPLPPSHTIEIPFPFRGWGRCALRLLRCYERQQQRRALRELDRHMLRDIGITREQAEAEARKPFWLSVRRAFTVSN
jgi:uncharacterized protein YjiS (DUF1127 family)